MPSPKFFPIQTGLFDNSIAAELHFAGVREDVGGGLSTAKKNYAESLSRALAQRFADALRQRGFPDILPDERGARHESRALGVKGPKRLDVNYSTPELGLGLGVSIKTIGFKDPKSRRYTKNLTARDNELRAEAEDYHLRQPFAVLVGLLFLPSDAADDGTAKTPSSFAAAVAHFRYRALRRSPTDRPTLFEKFYVAVYDTEPTNFGTVGFMDVEIDPPRRGKPRGLLTVEQVVDAIRANFVSRNSVAPTWFEEGIGAEDEQSSDDAD